MIDDEMYIDIGKSFFKLAKDLSKALVLIDVGEEAIPQKNVPEMTKTDLVGIKKKEEKVSLEDVRALLAKKSSEGSRETVVALLGIHGSHKLSEISEDKYGILLRQAQNIEKLSEIIKALEIQKENGFEEGFNGLFEHHFATSLADLDPNYYESFLRDAKALNKATGDNANA